MDKNTGKSKGYGFVTFKHVDGARIALKEPSKRIDGRMAVAQLASAGQSNVSLRKVYVGNVPFNLPAERLLAFFSMYGEIEEGPLGFDKSSGKPKGFAFFIYSSEEGARAAIADGIKNIDGHQVVCKLAIDNKKGKTQGQTSVFSDGTQPHSLPQSTMPISQYGTPSNFPNYGNGYGSYTGAFGVSQYGGPSANEFGGMTNGGNSTYRPPTGPIGILSGVYPNGGPYGLSQQNQLPRGPPGGLHQAMPPYY